MAWWNSSWNKKKKITLTGGSSGAQSAYQMKFDVVYDSDMKSDFSDLRFTNGAEDSLIDAWLESKVDSTSAVVWVETDTPADGVDADIYMYYGNGSVLNDWDGSLTFPKFFDDFSQIGDKFASFTKYGSNPLTSIPSYTGLGEVHPDVLYFPSGMDGYKYWMVYTPYPPNSAEWASIVRSNDGITWTDTGITNPVVNHAGWDHGSDPDMLYISSLSKWFMVWASHIGGGQYNICLAYSTDGKTWTEYDGVTINGNTNPIVLSGTDSGSQSWEYVAGPISKISYPSLIYESGTFYLYYGDHCAGGNRGRGGYATFTWNNTLDDVENFQRYGGNPVIDLSADSEFKSGSGHYDISYYDGTYYMYVMRELLGSLNYELALLTSTDKINWANKGNVLERGASGQWDDKYVYRASLVTGGEGTAVLFSGVPNLYYSGFKVSSGHPQIGLAIGVGEVLNTDKWNETNSPIIDIVGGVLELRGGASDQRNIISKTKQFSVDEGLRARVNIGTKDFIKKFGGKTVTGVGTHASRLTQILQYSGWANSQGGSGNDDGTNFEYVDFGTDYSGAYHNFDIVRYATGVKFLVDDVLKATASTNYHSADEYIFYEHYNSDLPSYMDWIFVHKYVTNPATYAFGGEENAPSSTIPIFIHHYNMQRRLI